MNDSARSGLGMRILGWAVLIVVALFVLKIAVGLVVGLVQFLVTIAFLALVAMAIIWAVRHL